MTRLDQLCQLERCGEGGGAINNVAGLIELIEDIKPRSVLEIGCWRGVSTEVFCIMCERVVTIDPFEDHDDHFLMAEHLAQQYGNLLVVRGFSPGVLRQLKGTSFDMVYIDAVHERDDVLADIQASMALGIRKITGHDYHPGNPGVIQAVNELFGRPHHVYPDSSWSISI